MPKKLKRNFPPALFVRAEVDGGEQFYLAEESLDGGAEDGDLVATYELKSVKTLRVARKLE